MNLNKNININISSYICLVYVSWHLSLSPFITISLHLSWFLSPLFHPFISFSPLSRVFEVSWLLSITPFVLTQSYSFASSLSVTAGVLGWTFFPAFSACLHLTVLRNCYCFCYCYSESEQTHAASNNTHWIWVSNTLRAPNTTSQPCQATRTVQRTAAYLSLLYCTSASLTVPQYTSMYFCKFHCTSVDFILHYFTSLYLSIPHCTSA